MKRIAFLGRGVHTLHTYRAVINRLTTTYSVTVFSETPIDPAWRKSQHSYSLVEGAWKHLSLRLNAVILFFTLTIRHLNKRFDIIHCHSTLPTGAIGVIFSKIFSIPVIVSLDGGEGISIEGVDFGDLRSKRQTKLNAWVLKHATVVTALTHYHSNKILRNLNIDRDIIILPRGVDVDLFHPRGHDGKFGDPIRFLFVGYLSPVKNPEFLIDVFSNLQSRIACTLTIVGKDYMQGRIQQRVALLGLDHAVNFIEGASYEAMPAIYQQADVLLVTSRYESQGMAIVEAMASGVLVCGLPVGLLTDLDDNMCVKIRSFDARAFAQQVLSVLADHERKQLLRNNAHQWSVENDINTTVRRLSEIYERLLR